METIFVLQKTAYTVKDGKLCEASNAEILEHITGDVFQAGNKTFVIKDKCVSLLAENMIPMAIIGGSTEEMPQQIKDFAQKCKNVTVPEDYVPSEASLLYGQYFRELSRFTPNNVENLVQNGVVLTKRNPNGRYTIELFIKNGHGDYVPEPRIIPISVGVRPAFIYKGSLYVQSARTSAFCQVDLTMLVASENYIIVWGGGHRLIAFTYQNGQLIVKELGIFKELINTKVSQILKVEDDRDEQTLFHVGLFLDRICSFSDDQRLTLDETTGKITRDYDVIIDGIPYSRTDVFHLIKGAYHRFCD